MISLIGNSLSSESLIFKIYVPAFKFSTFLFVEIKLSFSSYHSILNGEPLPPLGSVSICPEDSPLHLISLTKTTYTIFQISIIK